MKRILDDLATEHALTLSAAAEAEEWLLRPFRRRAAAGALRLADAKTKLTSMPHLARVARLMQDRYGAELDWDDEAAVAEAYATLPKSKATRLPLQTLSLFAGVLLMGAASFVVYLATRPFAADARGVGYALSHNLAGHVADVAKGARPTADAAIHRVFPRGELPSAARGPMTELFAAELAAADDATKMPAVFEKVRGVNRVFGDLGEPFYLDARYYLRSSLLYAYYKEREDRGSADGLTDERVVFLWRLDRLNLSKSVLGYTHREADAALVLYDQVEEFLIRDVLPCLADGETIELVDAASRDPQKAWQADIEARSARMVRESFAGIADHDQAVELGRLLARRRAIVKQWSGELKDQGRVLRAPTRLLPEADYVKDLELRVPTASRREWEDVHDALTSKAMLATFEALRDRFADDVARHELQHRFDGQKTRDCADATPCETLDIPEAVRSRVGPVDGAKVSLSSMPGRVRSETSAYLAEMTREGGMPKMTLLSLLRTVLDREAWGDAYCNTALVLLDVLGKEIGYDDTRMPLVAGGAVQRASVSSLVTLLFAKPDDELRLAAKKTWRALFGADVPDAHMTTVKRATRWRH